MENKEYVERLQLAIEHLHNCRAKHVGTEHVHESFQGQTVWDVDVEIFELIDRPKTNRCYAWSYVPRGGKDEQIATVLHIRPAMAPVWAVRVHIASEHRKRQAQVNQANKGK